MNLYFSSIYAMILRRSEGFKTSLTPNPNDSLKEIVMAVKALPCPTLLRQLVRYEPETGKLFWLARNSELFDDNTRSQVGNMRIWNAKHATKEAFSSVDTNGYLRGRFLGVSYLAHRIIFQMRHGYCPETLDHISGDKLDNRVENLRPASISQNAANYSKPSGSVSSFRGVSRAKSSSRWVAGISCAKSKKKIHLGSFKDELDAARAYDAAAIKMHGPFATTNFAALAPFTEAKP